MQTPYQVLQLKQKQRKKIINLSKKQRSFSVRYNKRGFRETELSIQKDKRYKTLDQKRDTLQQSNVEQQSSTLKKYQIIFRQSIRKVNQYRNKVYHTHSALKNQKFIQKFITSRQNQANQSKKQQSIEGKNTQKFKKLLDYRNKTGKNSEQKTNISNKIKNKIILSLGLQNNWLADDLPQFSIQKCKILKSSHQNRTKSKDYKNLKNQNDSIYQNEIDSCISERYSNPQNITQPFLKIVKKNPQNYDDIFRLSPQTYSFVNNKKKYLSNAMQFQQEETQMSHSSPASLNQTNVANFIKSKKRKRIPIQTRSPESKFIDQYQFRRTITDDLQNRKHTKDFLKNIEKGFFSPNKKNGCTSKIKINSLEDNITGWQIYPIQAETHNVQNTSKTIQS